MVILRMGRDRDGSATLGRLYLFAVRLRLFDPAVGYSYHVLPLTQRTADQMRYSATLM